ncbi:MAG: UDP-3-O-(3-hydroxymyristoyl)glucosamine N-acyltransferase [Saprospiraceae bacterium]|nr:UDP-3-O-(3-hydroxymyristoyl)glucosamine N-acyltransferase [Saprospiraceae bacterium]HRD80939.1 UDP-3-O-(3-hydroxymyristoyl)glucosamine N-acyltransferase [Saprospiraceae bacterium]
MQLSAKELAALLEGSIEGNPDVLVNRPGKIEEGQAGEITFLGNDKYEPFIYTTQASVVLVNKDFSPRQAIQATLIRVENVYAALAFLLDKFGAQTAARTAGEGISPQASIHPEAQIGQGVSIGPFAVVEAGASIGDGAKIGAQVFVGQGAAVGEESVLYPGVRILHDCRVGARCILHANAVVGSDGFGFAPQPDGTYKKIAQIGNVVIEDDVEIGAGTTIDRASLGSTILRKGVKLDNLIQVAHNVEIGENTVIAAQVGIAGSTKIGRNCRIAGQVGFIGHVTIADNTSIQAQSGVAQNVTESGTVICGYPAFAYRDYIRSHAVFKRLPELDKKIKQIEDKLK